MEFFVDLVDLLVVETESLWLLVKLAFSKKTIVNLKFEFFCTSFGWKNVFIIVMRFCNGLFLFFSFFNNFYRKISIFSRKFCYFQEYSRKNDCYWYYHFFVFVAWLLVQLANFQPIFVFYKQAAKKKNLKMAGQGFRLFFTEAVCFNSRSCFSFSNWSYILSRFLIWIFCFFEKNHYTFTLFYFFFHLQ